MRVAGICAPPWSLLNYYWLRVLGRSRVAVVGDLIKMPLKRCRISRLRFRVGREAARLRVITYAVGYQSAAPADASLTCVAELTRPELERGAVRRLKCERKRLPATVSQQSALRSLKHTERVGVRAIRRVVTVASLVGLPRPAIFAGRASTMGTVELDRADSLRGFNRSCFRFKLEFLLNFSCLEK